MHRPALISAFVSGRLCPTVGRARVFSSGKGIDRVCASDAPVFVEMGHGIAADSDAGEERRSAAGATEVYEARQLRGPLIPGRPIKKVIEDNTVCHWPFGLAVDNVCKAGHRAAHTSRKVSSTENTTV